MTTWLILIFTHTVSQCGAACFSAWQCVAACCSVLQRVAVCCSVWDSTNLNLHTLYEHRNGDVAHVNAFTCECTCCSVLQCVAVCCSVLQCVAVCDTTSHMRMHYVVHQNNTLPHNTLPKIIGLFCRILSLFYRALLQKRPTISRSHNFK